MSLDQSLAVSTPTEYGSSPSSAETYSCPTTAELPSPLSSSPVTQTVPASSSPKMYDSTLSPFERWAVRASDTQFNALAGAIGGFTSGVVTCPLDVIKTKLQAQGGLAAQKGNMGQHPTYKGLVGTASVIWRDEGLRGMYRGLGPIILGYLPTWAVWFTVYNKSKTVISQYQSTWLMPLCGSAVSCCFPNMTSCS